MALSRLLSNKRTCIINLYTVFDDLLDGWEANHSDDDRKFMEPWLTLVRL